MSEIGKKIDKVIKEGLSKIMKENGFKKSGRTFLKKVEDGWHIVNVQSSSGNLGVDGKFSVNLGIISNVISEKSGLKIPLKPKEYDSTVRERLGILVHGNDYWWDISDDTDILNLANEISENMSRYGFPWLQNYSSIKNISDKLKQQPSLQSISAALLAGNESEAKARYDKILLDRPAAKSMFKSWARNSGLSW
ncbi:DUF4304 domain-containing protein [Marinobacterium marinum]|uniref:DUF4304 domain-containing protein n=1 Tax=Marinobacterium marinum TaxID=2756129 RepID=A0A7W2AB47_9GAMM|nr:DUF4304 domain-containing protein [Marinobacterium marinum]MBA4501102.1 DUF4304 domain-containing protein [Marinobacterium marinum]